MSSHRNASIFCCASSSDAKGVQALLARAPVERFNHRVVRRLAAAAEVEDDAVGVGPETHGGTEEIGTVVAVDVLVALPASAQRRLQCKDSQFLATNPIKGLYQ